MNTEQVSKLIADRNDILEKDYESKDADRIKEEILKAIKNNFNQYPCDFIIETLTHLGYAPQLVYDDNGLFAVALDGYQPVVFGKEKIEGNMTVFVEKKQWKPSIRLALHYFIKSLKIK